MGKGTLCNGIDTTMCNLTRATTKIPDLNKNLKHQHKLLNLLNFSIAKK